MDEYSFVLEGEIGVLMGEETFRAPAGSYVLKVRGVPPTFWKPGPNPARVLEIISPAGFEEYFEELAAILPSTLPKEFGCSGVTCWRRLRDWRRAGVWHALRLVLLGKLGRLGCIDWSRASLDSASVPAKKGASRPTLAP